MVGRLSLTLILPFKKGETEVYWTSSSRMNDCVESTTRERQKEARGHFTRESNVYVCKNDKTVVCDTYFSSKAYSIYKVTIF